MIDEVCAYLSSKQPDEWIELNEIVQIFRKYDLTDAEAKSALDFLTKYFLELDESGRRVRLTRSFYDLCKEE